MNQYLSFIKSKANFNNPPVDFDTWGQYDYDVLKHEKYCYNTYRHFLKSYLVNPKENTVFDINCGKGYGISHLEKEFGFKKCIGFQYNNELLKICKDTHDNVSFYKDFILSAKKNADFILAFNSLQLQDNKTALLMKIAQSLHKNGTVIIVNQVYHQHEYDSYINILVKTHGLKLVENYDISPHVVQATDRMAEINSLQVGSHAHNGQFAVSILQNQ